MSGHSKWAQIKRQKGAADLKRGAVFSKLANAITMAVHDGGKDPAMNVRLRLTIEKARAANMPKDNIERAIKRGAGEIAGKHIERITYEGYGPEGVAVVAEALTDNRNRTTAELRQLFSEYGGNLASANSVLWLFERQGLLEVKPNGNREALELAAIDAGALDIEQHDGTLVVATPPPRLDAVREILTAKGGKVQSAAIALVPKATVTPASHDAREKIQKLLNALEEVQDVTNIATNADV